MKLLQLGMVLLLFATPVMGLNPLEFGLTVEFTIQEDHVLETGDYQVYINLSQLGDDFWDNVTTDGRDIRFTDDGDNEVNFDFDYFNHSERDAPVYVLRTVSSSADTIIRMYWNNTSLSAPSDAFTQATWFGVPNVFHFSDPPNTDGLLNTIIGGSNLTEVNFEDGDLVTGLLGKSVDFDGTDERFDGVGVDLFEDDEYSFFILGVNDQGPIGGVNRYWFDADDGAGAGRNFMAYFVAGGLKQYFSGTATVINSATRTW